MIVNWRIWSVEIKIVTVVLWNESEVCRLLPASGALAIGCQYHNERLLDRSFRHFKLNSWISEEKPIITRPMTIRFLLFQGTKRRPIDDWWPAEFSKGARVCLSIYLQVYYHYHYHYTKTEKIQAEKSIRKQLGSYIDWKHFFLEVMKINSLEIRNNWMWHSIMYSKNRGQS